MKNPGNNIRRSLLKRQKAIDGFKTKKDAFFTVRNDITKDIEKARSTWRQTLEQLPGQEF
jgi:hypothetical protein